MIAILSSRLSQFVLVRMTALVTACVLGFATLASAQYEVLHTFPAPGPVRPYAPLVQATDGNFYGTTAWGGVSDQGAVFRMDSSGTVTIMHEFLGAPNGGQPYGSLVQAADGNLYGTTWDGGANDKGSIFRMTLGGVVTIVHSFTAATHGANPLTAMIIGTDGNFYGTTSVDGPAGFGTIFRFTLQGTFSVVHAFPGGASNGANPYAPVIQGADGALYGTTRDGGTSAVGTVFKTSLPGGETTVLHSFNGANGRYPTAGLVQGIDTHLYGTTSMGGAGNIGTIFRVTLGGTHTLLKSFAGGVDSREPVAALVQKPDGNFYGTTQFQGVGPSYYGGIVFEMTPAGSVTTVHNFNNVDGGWPSAGLIRGTDGHYYGTTQRGGTAGYAGAGTVYRISTGGVFTLMHSFDGGPGGGRPRSPLVRATDGNLYGNTVIGGHADLGMIFKMTPTGTVTHLHSFDGVTDSQYPQSNFEEAPDGLFYGGIQPVIYKMTKTGTFTILRVLDAPTEGDGANNLTRATDGNYYGTTDFYGPANKGTLFRTTPTGDVTLLHIFTGGVSDGDAPTPNGKLVQGADGALYGTTVAGGATNHGVIFKITTAGVFTLLHSFNNAVQGSAPRGPLLLASDGNFYGTTSTGGPGTAGTIFRMTPAGVVTVVHSFTGNVTDGAYPFSGLVQSPTGTLYGTSSLGGVGHAGTVFSLTLGGTFAVVHSFSGGAAGSGPASTPTLLGGHLYGTTVYGGIASGLGMGIVFRVAIPTLPFTDPTLTPGTTSIKAAHVMELRSRIDNMRASRAMAAFSWGAALTPGTAILAQHIVAVRTALGEVYSHAGRTAPSYTDPALATGASIKAIHITELRAAVVAIE
jgi:uncharacterized repeat protein (TIGR03803 family)